MAYALDILIQIVEQDQHYLFLDLKSQIEIETLWQRAIRLSDLLVVVGSRVKKDVQNRIRDAAYRAEDLIEFHIRDRLLSVNTSVLDLTDVIEELDSIRIGIQMDWEPIISAPQVSSSSLVLGPCLPSTVGALATQVTGLRLATEARLLDHDLTSLLDPFYDDHQIIAIVGMAGTGKTTLAHELLNRVKKSHHFDYHAWITLPLKFDIRMILLALFDCLEDGGITNPTNYVELDSADDLELGVLLYKALFGRRYLIVLDDLWDTTAWDKLAKFIPKNMIGSRIIVTCRDQKVARDIYARCYQMPFLSDTASWKLLCTKVFGKNSCPPELEKFGKKIADRCQGVPLAVGLIAGLLLSNQKVDYWEHVAMNISSMGLLLDSDTNTLSRSYDSLPCHLKPCFLYVGLFPEDYAIQVSRIIKLWIAEGFVKQTTTETFEDTAYTYLQALIDANLLLVCEREDNGRIKTFKIHFLIGEMCKKIAIEEKFLSKNLEVHEIPEDGDHLRHVSVNPVVQLSSKMKLTSRVRSFMCVGPASRELAPLFLGLSLLRVLDVFQLEFFHFPTELLQLVHLRFLALSCHSDLPSSICKLKNLQTLVIHRLPSFRAFSLPSQLWELAQLRHIKCTETCIWHFPENGVGTSQENLQTLSTIQMFVVTDEFLDHIPNLRKLGLFCNKAVHRVIHLERLSKLEKLKCSSNLSQATHNFLSYFIFPPSLRKLTLSFCKIPWGFMENVGQLPNLEQLRLRKCTFLGIGKNPIEAAEDLPCKAASPTWELAEEQFQQLKFLQMEDLNLVHWKVSGDTTLPELQHLVIRRCCSMMGIPVSFGKTAMLEIIEVDEYSSPSVVASANKIVKEQDDHGNYVLLHVGRSQGTGQLRDYQEMIGLDEHTFERNQDMEAKRKSYVQKLKERISFNEEDTSKTRYGDSKEWMEQDNQELIGLNEHTFERNQDMVAKRKSFVLKLEERISLNEEDTSKTRYGDSKETMEQDTLGKDLAEGSSPDPGSGAPDPEPIRETKAP